MRGEELLDILEQIDPALIRDADRKPRLPWLRWTAIAACLALLVGVGALFLPRLEPVPARTPLPMVDLVNHTVNPEKLTGVQILGSPVSGTPGASSATQGVPPVFDYEYNLMVEARVLEVLPDVYHDARLPGWKYHVLRMQTLEAVVGQGFPREFYLRLDSKISTDLEQFDSLIFSLVQVGIEDYMMVNQTTSATEAFTLMFDMTSSRWSMYNTAIAFSDGELDPTLWDLVGWDLGSYYEKQILKGDYYRSISVKQGTSPEEAKENIARYAADRPALQSLRVMTQADYPEKEIFDYVRPFENGVFAHALDKAGSVEYTRLINGFHTTEQIELYKSLVYRRGEAFTPEDLESLPDLGGFISELDLENLQQPNAELYQGKWVELLRKGATGYYAKVGGKVYGIVKVTWWYVQNDIYDVRRQSFYDALYYLVDADGSVTSISYEELRSLIGNADFLAKPSTAAELARVPDKKE